MMETALSLGQIPVAACELRRYRADITSVDLPAQVTDLGLRGSPNIELLQLSRPDLILSSPFYTQIEPRLSRIAPVFSHETFTPGAPPWPKALDAITSLGAALGLTDEALVLQDRIAATLHDLRGRVAPHADRPLYLAEIGDARHVRVFGADSLFGSMLDTLGLDNAWTGATRFSFAAPVPLERLAEVPQARIILVEPVPVVARRGLAGSALWAHLPAVAEGRVRQLSGLNPYGGAPSGLAFAEGLTRALEADA